MEDVELWQECEEVHHHGAAVQPHTGMFGSMSSHSHATIGHVECCVPSPPPPQPLLSQWGLYESWISPRGGDELHDMITFIPSSSGDDGPVAAVDRGLSQASLQPQAGAIDSLQEVGNRAAWGHGFYNNQAAMNTEVHALDSRESAAPGVPDHMLAAMIDQYLQTLSNSSSPFNYNVLQGASESMIMESSLGSVFDKVWNCSRTDPFAAAMADHSLITNPGMGSMFHSISTGSCLNLYLESNKCEALEKGTSLMTYLQQAQNKLCDLGAQGSSSSLMLHLQQNKCESHELGSLMYLSQNKCEAQDFTLKPRGASQLSGTEELGISSPGACSYIAEESLQRQKLQGSLALVASSLPSPLLMPKKKKKNMIMSSAAAATSELVQKNINKIADAPQKQNILRNNILSVVGAAASCPYVSSSRSTSTVAAESHDDHTMNLQAYNSGGQTWFMKGSETLAKSTNNTAMISNSTKLVFSQEEQFNTHLQIRTDPNIVQPGNVIKWPPNIITVVSDGPAGRLEEKHALPPPPPPPPPPPLAVMKCALPRRNNIISGSRVAAAAAASNVRKRTLWPVDHDNNNKISTGFVHKKPIAKWPVVVEGCSRLEAVSTLAHHTLVTQNKCNARNLGPALNTNLKPRARQGSANDPQSIAARIRRERISDRLKVLQLLIPNGDKVDMVTMLEKAINYVQCLELQIRMLKDDSLWPKALGVLPNTLQELLELEGPEFAALREEEEEHNKKRAKIARIKELDPLSSPVPS